MKINGKLINKVTWNDVGAHWKKYGVTVLSNRQYCEQNPARTILNS